MLCLIELLADSVLRWWSGLAAAYKLKSHGLDVTVFEAERRAGGKLRSVSLDGLIWDEGANTMVDFFIYFFVNKIVKVLWVGVIWITVKLDCEIFNLSVIATMYTSKVCLPCVDWERGWGPKSAWWSWTQRKTAICKNALVFFCNQIFLPFVYIWLLRLNTDLFKLVIPFCYFFFSVSQTLNLWTNKQYAVTSCRFGSLYMILVV